MLLSDARIAVISLAVAMAVPAAAQHRGGGARAPARETVTMPGVRAGQNVPPEARAALLQRAASGAVAGGVLLNRSFANRPLRDPADRALAFSTFHGRFGNLSPAWRRRHHHAFVIGWVGPLFWPYAYEDLFDYAFYPHAYDTFWPYAYDDVYQGVFGAYAYGYGQGDDAMVGRTPRSDDNANDNAHAQAGAPVTLCTTQTAVLINWPIDRIVQTIEPDDSQRVTLNALRGATTEALDILRNACPTTLPGTPTGRLTAMRERLDAMLQAVRTIRPALEDFYGMLDDEQKARFNAMDQENNQDQPQARRDLTQVCDENAAGIGNIPLGRIESTLQITDPQRDAFEALQSASLQATESLKASCPIFQTLTPTGRVAAMEERLDTMLQAAKLVEPALAKFYSDLSDEQKERFNRLAPAQG